MAPFIKAGTYCIYVGDYETWHGCLVKSRGGGLLRYKSTLVICVCPVHATCIWGRPELEVSTANLRPL